MKLENQVCSLELAKRLKELGVKQESLFYHDNTLKKVAWTGNIYLAPVDFGMRYVSAFTVAELGEMLKKYEMECIWFEEQEQWGCYQTCDGYEPHYADTEADARARMLIYLLENGLLK
jgi:hypothetical protein